MPYIIIYSVNWSFNVHIHKVSPKTGFTIYLYQLVEILLVDHIYCMVDVLKFSVLESTWITYINITEAHFNKCSQGRFEKSFKCNIILSICVNQGDL